MFFVGSLVQDITIGQAALTIGQLGGIGVLLIAVFGLWSRFNKLERGAAYRQEGELMTYTCLSALLEAAIEQGANGPVHKARDEMDTFLRRRASGFTGGITR